MDCSYLVEDEITEDDHIYGGLAVKDGDDMERHSLPEVHQEVSDITEVNTYYAV